MPKLRAYGALIAVVLVTLPLSNYFQAFWVRARINESERTWGWWSPRWLALTWGWEVLVAVVAALGLALLLPRGSRFRWYVGLGVVYALVRSEEHTSELQSQSNLVCRLLLEKKKSQTTPGLATSPPASYIRA